MKKVYELVVMKRSYCQGSAKGNENLFFAKTGTFYLMPEVDLKPLDEIFHTSVFKMLKEKEMINFGSD